LRVASDIFGQAGEVEIAGHDVSVICVHCVRRSACEQRTPTSADLMGLEASRRCPLAFLRVGRNIRTGVRRGEPGMSERPCAWQQPRHLVELRCIELQ
jgi:hypothetical protein